MVNENINVVQDYIVEVLGTLLLFWMMYQIYALGSTWVRFGGVAVALTMMGYKKIGEIVADIAN